jgi:hypothetical protein
MNSSVGIQAGAPRARTASVSIKGRAVSVPVTQIAGHDLIAMGRWPRIATVRDEEWLETTRSLDPRKLADDVAGSSLRADILAISGVLDQPAIEGLPFETDNVAIIDTSDFKAWWESLPQEARKNTRRAAKRGIEIRTAEFDDALVRGIKAIYDEAPLRQGRPFWHYGKDIETVRRENETYRERSEFLGAYLGTELVGFMKWVYVGDAARIMQILCLNAHQDKRPIIALIAKAAEICHQKGMRYLVYGKYTYGRKVDSSIAEFKKRLGFHQLDFPRYYIPLNLRGRMAISLGVHTGLKNLLPASVLARLLAMRSAWLNWRTGKSAAAGDAASGTSAADSKND